MSQGIMPTVECFQREMSHLCPDSDFAKVYLHNMIMHTNGNEQHHMNKISTLMERSQQHNLKVKVSKYKWLKKSLIFRLWDYYYRTLYTKE